MNSIRIFKALGEETRLRIINLLVQSKQSLCVCEMTDALLVPQYQISRHLMVLKNLGIMHTERRGTWVYYTLERNASPFMADLMNLIEKYFKDTYADDIQRLNERLNKREDGVCVVGFTTK